MEKALRYFLWMFPVAVILMVLLILAAMAITIVPTGYVGVWLEFGKATHVVEPGIYLAIPFKDRVVLMSTQIEKMEVPASSASKDLQIVSTVVAVNYQIEADEQNVLNLWSRFWGNHEERIVQPLLQEVVKATTAEYTAEELITRRPEVSSKMTSRLREKLGKYGIIVHEVSIVDFDFSPQFNAAIEEKVVAEQKMLRERYELERKQIEVQKQIAEANASATAKIIEAQGDAQARIIRAQAEAEAIKIVSEQLANSGKDYLIYRYIDQWDGVLPYVLGQEDIIVDMGDFEEYQ